MDSSLMTSVVPTCSKMVDMQSLECKLCKLSIKEVATLKKHLRKEHEVLNYMVDLTLALSLLNKEEEEQLVRITKDRLENFEKTKLLTRKEMYSQKQLILRLTSRAPPFTSSLGPLWVEVLGILM